MRYAAAYVLAILGGNSNPDVTAISKILGSVGVDCDNTKAQKVVDACKGKDVEQIIAEGTKKLSSLPTGGGGAVAASAGAPAAAAATTDAKKGGAKEEAKKPEKKKEESDEEGDDMVCIRKGNSINIFIFIFRVLVYLIK
jgi:large subunit ribosomal protein LP2